MQAIILAAGMGKRLKELTAANTKCMVKVNGVTLIERMLGQLDELGLARIVIVIGYEGRKLVDFIATLNIATPIRYIENPVYFRTNNIYSLFLARETLVEDDTLLLESDLIFDHGALRDLLDDPRPTLALVDKYKCWMDGTVVKIDANDHIISFVPGSQFRFEDIQDYYKTVNIYKFSKEFSRTHYVPFLEAYSIALGNNEYYEQVLRVITMLDDSELQAKHIAGRWYEIDDLQDLDIAESMFVRNGEQYLERIQQRYGGYWRYPELLDFCYLVNPYYPPRRLLEEMKANFERLLTQYPSGMRVNALLAAKTFGVRQEHIMAGNGAAELIKALLADIDGKVGLIRPTFEEYPNRLRPDRVAAFVPPEIRYGADEVMSHFTGRDIAALVLVNPDNPSGNYLPKVEVERLAAWCREADIRLVYDESFADFADEPDNSFLDEALLQRHPTMVVVKSISKSYGVPGARLGVLASADQALLDRLKCDVSIWNINSFGEFFLQIMEKYQGAYRAGLEKFRAGRARLARALGDVPRLRVLPSQANFLMAEIRGGMSAAELTRRLLWEKNILIKELSGKMAGRGEYVRLAVRDDRDNDVLVDALNGILR